MLSESRPVKQVYLFEHRFRSHSNTPAGERPRVLIACPPNHHLPSAQLSILRHTCDFLYAHSGSAALDLSKQYRVSGVVVARDLPDMEGAALMGAVRTHNPHCVFVFISQTSAASFANLAQTSHGTHELSENATSTLELAAHAMGAPGGAAFFNVERWLRSVDCTSAHHARQALHYMLAHFSNASLRTGTIAAAIGISLPHLGYVMAACASKTCAEVLREIRVAEATWLIDTTNLSIKEIVHKCGYHSYGALGHHFRNATGMLPREWRRRPTLVDKLEVLPMNEKHSGHSTNK